MREENIEAVRAACIKANPEIDTGETVTMRGATIRLADVLLAAAYSNIPGFYVDRNGDIEAKGEYIRAARWNLRTDDLTAQSDQCIAFLTKLLAA